MNNRYCITVNSVIRYADSLSDAVHVLASLMYIDMPQAEQQLKSVGRTVQVYGFTSGIIEDTMFTTLTERQGTIVGYKATHSNMTCRGYQFELGKKHTIEGDVVIGKSGFHICHDLVDVFKHYIPGLFHDDIRVFKVVGSGQICSFGNKVACQSIQFTEEVTIEQMMTQYGDNKHVRLLSAYKKHMLDQLVNDSEDQVRLAVAIQGYGLDRLISDDHWQIREMVAKQKYGLDQLVNDRDWCVRYEVANQGYGLDVLINDSHMSVSLVAAKKLAQEQIS